MCLNMLVHFSLGDRNISSVKNKKKLIRSFFLFPVSPSIPWRKKKNFANLWKIIWNFTDRNLPLKKIPKIL